MPDVYSNIRSIRGSSVPLDPIRCPKCLKGNITLHGMMTREFTETRTDGQSEGTPVFADELEREIKSLDCHDCKITFQIMTPDEANLAYQNGLLVEEVLVLTGGKGLRGASGMVH